MNFGKSRMVSYVFYFELIGLIPDIELINFNMQTTVSQRLLDVVSVPSGTSTGTTGTGSTGTGPTIPIDPGGGPILTP
jgi:hypothetical protein